jgi:hypothetical protein
MISEAQKKLIAKLVCDSIECDGPLYYVITDGEDDPDVTVRPSWVWV